MILPPSELPLYRCACLAAVPLLVFVAAPAATRQDDAEAKAIVARIDAWRGKAKNASLTLEGTFTVTFEGVPVAGTELKGKFRSLYSGAKLARHTADLGEHGVMESGTTEALVWEVDPTTGARVLAGAPAQAVRRWHAIVRGASPSDLYAKIERQGSEAIDGREHARLVMTPAEGKADTWYVDPKTGCVARIETFMPAPEGMQHVWGTEPEIAVQAVFGDWREVGGVKHAYRRAEKMGPATLTFVCEKIEAGAPADAARFAPPEAVRDAKPAEATPSPAGEAAPYQVIERRAQPVASVRVKCKSTEISATLSEILPEVMAHLNASGAKMSGPPFSRYHGFGAGEVDLEAGIPVFKPIVEKGRIKNGELPAGKTVTAWHVGPYEKLGGAHQALQAHLAEKGYKPRGGAWEVYWTDPGIVSDPAKWKTQLFAPIE